MSADALGVSPDAGVDTDDTEHESDVDDARESGLWVLDGTSSLKVTASTGAISDDNVLPWLSTSSCEGALARCPGSRA